ncbi:MAG: hypothetical protein Q9219_005026 [cf. Caloplaca sp. 3 TL-2023]
MKNSKEMGGSAPRSRRQSVPQTLLSPFGLVLNRFFALLVPRDWSRHTLANIINTVEDHRRDEMVKTYIESEQAKMNTTGAALIAGVISSSFSWYNIDDTTWVTRSAWYSGLVLSIASVANSAIHTAAFLRMKCDTDVTERFRQALGKNRKPHERWQPHALTTYVLGGPTLHLKLAVFMFLLGLFYELWRAAVHVGLSWHGDDLKIAFIVTLVGGFVVVNYLFSVFTLVHHSMHTG